MNLSPDGKPTRVHVSGSRNSRRHRIHLAEVARPELNSDFSAPRLWSEVLRIAGKVNAFVQGVFEHKLLVVL